MQNAVFKWLTGEMGGCSKKVMPSHGADGKTSGHMLLNLSRCINVRRYGPRRM